MGYGLIWTGLNTTAKTVKSNGENRTVSETLIWTGHFSTMRSFNHPVKFKTENSHYFEPYLV